MAEKKKISTTLKTLILTDNHEKAKTIKKFLGRQYLIISSEGFLRDLPKSRLAINIEDNFEPECITIRGKGKLLEQLRKESLNARRIYAITNLDFEGEKLAYHYCELFGINSSSNFRVELNELTKESLKKGIENARAVNKNFVDAYEARRTINRLFVYKLHPILWHKIYRGISINFPQAVILKMICDQEKKLQPLSNGISIDEIAEEWSKPLTWKTLQLIASVKLNFHIGMTAIIMRQLYEGINIENTCTGLITYYKGESIEPTSEMRTPESLKKSLTPNQFKLYNLIWQHYQKENLEPLKSSMPMNRYNDYLLMRALDTKKISWEDTFSIAICTMLKRGYINLTDEGYKPSELAFEIINVLKEYFLTTISAKTVNRINSQIQAIAKGELNKIDVIESFYKTFGNNLKKAVEKLGGDLTPKEPPIIETDEICEKCGRKMIIRRSRYGLFLACAGYPECKNTKPYVSFIEKKCPKCGKRLTMRKLTKGKVFYSCEGFPECNFSTWDEPQEKICESCGSTMFLHKFKDRAPMLYCGNENCSSRNEHPINKILEHLREKAEKSRQKKIEKEKGN